MSGYDLSRFLKAHERDYARALFEIREGHKESHWMWYIFPQIAGLGMSDISIRYAIKDIGEARAYMEEPVLGGHMIEICEALLGCESDDADEVLGYPDNLKHKSSMTLFEVAMSDMDIFGKVLDKFFGGTRDSKTLGILERMGA